MGKILASFYEEIKKEGGLAFQMRLAMATSMSQQQCEVLPDSRDNIDRFHRAYKAITGKKATVG